MARVKANLFFEPEFKQFLEHLKQKSGIPISQIVERATLEKYEKEYAQFLQENEKQNDK